MKKIIICFVLLCSFTSNGQLRDNNLNAIDVSAGYVPDGYGVNLGYNLYFSGSRSNNYLQLSGLYTDSEVTKERFELPYNLFAMNAGYFFHFPLEYREKINLNIGGGLTVGFEQLNDGDIELNTGARLSSDGGFIYGPFVGGEFDFFLSDTISFLIKGNWYYHINSEIGDFTLFAGGGFRIFL